MISLRNILGVISLVSLATGIGVKPAEGCSAFSCTTGGAVITAKNYDWTLGDGLLIVNQRGVTKTSRLFPDPQAPRWTSRYGSVTFNQYGRDLPQGGMNEAGLVVEVLWLEGTEYPADDARDDIGCSQWVQNQLDTAATVEEVIASFAKIQIRAQVPLHFFVADSTGCTASLEFIEGRQVFHAGDAMPVQVLTNSPYAEALECFTSWSRRSEDVPTSSGSLDRFVRCASMTRQATAAPDASEFAFGILDGVRQPGFTQWSTVYDQTRRVVSLKTLGNPTVRSIDFAAQDFACGRPVSIADIDASPIGGAIAWRPYSYQDNLNLVTKTYRGTPFLHSVPDSLYAVIAGYPEQSRCTR
ncbi:MAG: linear amide C-N hydrolase [Candidatus Eisenbacteria bacterium]|nr:linear amide C-N hydrolase [Candidatus Eisenbacteria bacterium]